MINHKSYEGIQALLIFTFMLDMRHRTSSFPEACTMNTAITNIKMRYLGPLAHSFKTNPRITDSIVGFRTVPDWRMSRKRNTVFRMTILFQELPSRYLLRAHCWASKGIVTRCNTARYRTHGHIQVPAHWQGPLAVKMQVLFRRNEVVKFKDIFTAQCATWTEGFVAKAYSGETGCMVWRKSRFQW